MTVPLINKIFPALTNQTICLCARLIKSWNRGLVWRNKSNAGDTSHLLKDTIEISFVPPIFSTRNIWLEISYKSVQSPWIFHYRFRRWFRVGFIFLGIIFSRVARRSQVYSRNITTDRGKLSVVWTKFLRKTFYFTLW